MCILSGVKGSEAANNGPWVALQAVPQREADLMPLVVRARRGSPVERARAQAELEAELASRSTADRAVREVVRSLLHQPGMLQLFQVSFFRAGS